MMTKLKIEYDGEMRRSQVAHPLTMTQLRDTMQQLFNVDVQGDQYRVSYVDEEGDTIVVTSDVELLEVEQVFASAGKAVRLLVEPVRADMLDEPELESEPEPVPEPEPEPEADLLSQLPEAMKLFADYVGTGMPPAQAVQQVLAEMPQLALQAGEAHQHFRHFCRGFGRRGRPCRGRGRGRGGFRGRGRGRGRAGFMGMFGPLLRPRGCMGGWSVGDLTGRGHFGAARSRAQSLGLNAEFVRHVSLPESTPVMPGSVHVKTWLLRNTGSVAWPQGTQLLLVKDHHQVFQQGTFDVPLAQPGEQVEVSVPLRVPLAAERVHRGRRGGRGRGRGGRRGRGGHRGGHRGRHLKALFRLVTPDEQLGQLRFGDRLWLHCDVVEPVAEPEPMAAEPESEPMAAEPEVEPMAAEPVAEPMAAEPVAEPEPMAAEPEPVDEPMEEAAAYASATASASATAESECQTSPQVQQVRQLLGIRVAGLSDAELAQLLLAFDNDVRRFTRDVFGQ